MLHRNTSHIRTNNAGDHTGLHTELQKPHDDPESWVDGFTHPAAARGLILDRDGNWLLVHPADGRQWWHIPGGDLKPNEAPTAACRREIFEEIGLHLMPGPLYTVGWTLSQPGGIARFSFVFHMGIHDRDDLDPRIRLQMDELDAWQWVQPDEALRLLHPHVAYRLTARSDGAPTAVYRELRADATVNDVMPA